ncbi:aldehyde dehydrogenase [Streptomyces sp. NBC_01166]|uniref:aldehyde dehydrogenase n=1 Tax=Streptomyces sp. NBC_01166 TaxID=2903755 RepID=UPI0038696084
MSPVTEEPIAAIPAGTPDDMDRAVAAARGAFEGGWATSPLEERVGVLQRLRDAIEANSEELAQLITREMGCPITQSRNIQVVAPLGVLDSYLRLARDFRFDEVRRSLKGAAALVTREAVGVVAAVIPWNMPLSIAVQKITPALLAGCTVVLKPSPEAPLSSYRLVELLAEAGLPPGVVNMVPADREASEYLVTHPGVDKVSFTGSSVAGRRIAALCGQDLRRVSLELGGKSAALILDDADLDQAVEALRLGSFRNSGQICTLKTRILVSPRRHQELLDRLVALVESMPLGDPGRPETHIGPLVSARQRSVVEKYLAIARDEGTKAVIGGGRPQGFSRGWYVEPTVLTGVDPGMRIAQEEVFGPVVSVLTYTDEDDAVAIANNSTYGLSGAVFTTDTGHGLEIARRIRTGIVELNGNPSGPGAPMGGFKGSGLGRENGPEGLGAYTELKSIGLPRDMAERLA